MNFRLKMRKYRTGHLYKIKKRRNVIKNSYEKTTVLQHSRILKSIL
ncbi:hypothetical protein GS511_06590 [Leptospira borgpetersenii]|nr:hypothetical protein GS524_06585 [Leptospira borgpetersenii]QHE29987.1 hypothetical protein GS523_06595 [Leptospira borgpetersenii]QHE33293.1 hypothetical protein GS517_06590 [Leptospira borgpetersenii]QHE36523.1 hypothetical protein GS510_06235 [Leptospira borgpetersenii]QHE39881.1 hypothetical protein GS527_06865 [Leptospira borgpetersenii]